MIKFKKLTPEAQAPVRATEGSGAVDLVATSIRYTADYIEYGTGLAFEIPPGHLGLCAARSSVSNKKMVLANGIGYIDSDYRGEVTFRFKQLAPGVYYKVGERIGQLTIVPIVEPVYTEVDELTTTARGTGGYGSTGV